MTRIYFFLLILASTPLALIGCGGSSASVGLPASGNANFNGSTTVSTTSTSAATVPASGGTTISTGDAGTGGTAVIPSGAVSAGTVVPPGTELAVIPAGTGFSGNFSVGSSLSVNGVADSGIGVSGTGLTAVNMALPVAAGGTSYTLTYPGGNLNTFAVEAKQPRILTIRATSIVGRYYVLTGPLRVISPVPTEITGRIPNNGQNAMFASVVAGFGPGNNGRTATLTIDYGTGFGLNKTETIANSRVAFDDLQKDSQNVPANGIALIRLVVGDLP